MTTRTPAPVPYVEGLPEFLEAAGFRVRLDVQRADGQPLTADERAALALAVESYQAGGSDRTDDELAGAAQAAAPRAKTKRAPSRTAARMGRTR